MRFLSLFCGLATTFTLTAETDPFPPFESLKPPVLMRQGAEVTVSKEGHFLVDGVPRYLEGTIYYEGTTPEVATRTYGYPAILNWLYESTQDYRDLQRLGFDTVGTPAPNWWIDKYRSRYIRNGIDEKMQNRYLEAGLPIYVDYTCAPWHHGAMKHVEGKEPSKAAFPVPGRGNNHWVPYSLTTPEGRKLWLEMWTYGIEYYKKLGAKPLVYELFNEPDYNDWSDFNRALFSERMKKQYSGDLARLNREWGTSYKNFEAIGNFKFQAENVALSVEWIKFMEEAFADICAEGVKTMRAVDTRPEAGFCFQPLSGWRSVNTNLYLTNRHMNMLTSGTGGGDLLHAHFLRAIGDGKPIMDGETYMGKTRSSFRNKIWRQYARGFNATYIFKWSRRGNDPRWKLPQPDGAKLLAEVFPYMVLNPYAVPAEAFLGLMDAKKEILQVADLFTPRDRGIPRQVALLFSYPTHRLGRSAGQLCSNLVVSYGEALEYAQLPLDIVLEEQLPEGRLDRYPILVAAGVDATYPETTARLEAWVRKGGVLILGQEALQSNEYGSPKAGFPGLAIGKERSGERDKLAFGDTEVEAASYKDVIPDSSWQSLASLGGKPVLLEKTFGKGKVIYLNAKLPGGSLGQLLTALLAREKIRPTCLLTDAETGARIDGVEVTKAARDGFTGYILINQRLAPRLVRFTPPEKVPFIDIALQRRPEMKDGSTLLLLQPGTATVLLGGEAAALEKRCGKLPLKPHAELETEGKAAIEAFQAKIKENAPAFTVDRDRIRIVDLRHYANRDFVDRVPGDGKGGWTDQGANSLHGVEWGVKDCAGVPFEFIRTDQNEERTCIVLGSKTSLELPKKIEGIKVDLPADRLFFLHCAAWCTDSGQEGFRYVIHYADGTREEIPIREGIEVGDWFHALYRTGKMQFHPGFVNSEKRGVFVWAWKNPHPAKTIETIDIVSADTNLIPILAGLTVELPGETKAATPLFTGKPKVGAWGKAKGVVHPDRIELRVDDQSTNWCGVNIQLPLPLAVPAGATKLVLEVNSGVDQWGKQERGDIPFQVSVSSVDAAGKALKATYVTPPEFIIDADPTTWQKAELPLARLLPKAAASITRVTIQFKLLPAERCGIEVRNLRLE